MKMYLKNKNGYAMVLVMIIVAVIPLLAGALYMYASNSILHAERYEDIEQAKYLARSGTDAIIKIWLESEADDKPQGVAERVYFMANGQFMVEDELTQEQIDDNTIGYIESVITNYTDITEDNYGSSSISTTAYVGITKQEFNVTTSSRLTGNDSGWYNQTTGRFYLGPNVYTYTTEIDGDDETFYLRSFDPADIVTCDSLGSKFTIPTGEQVGLNANAIFFKDPVDLEATSANQEVTALIITSKYTVFEQPVYLERNTFWGRVNEYATVVLNTSENSGVELEGKDGLYSMVYFQGGVYEGWQTVIEPGTAWYVKKQENGVDLLKWFFEDRIFWGDGDEAAYFFMMDPGDDNKVVPNEAFLVSFTYE